MSKTIYECLLGTKDHSKGVVKLDTKLPLPFECVKYLNSNFHKDGNIDQDVKHTIKFIQIVSYDPIIITTKVKENFYRIAIGSTLLYD